MASPTLSIGVAHGIGPETGVRDDRRGLPQPIQGWDGLVETGDEQRFSMRPGFRKEGEKAVRLRVAPHQVTGWTSVA